MSSLLIETGGHLLLETGGLLLLQAGAVALTWIDAENAIRQQIEAQWPLTDFASMPLTWENQLADLSERYMAVNIEGHAADKTLIGSVGKRSSLEYGIVYFHAFTPTFAGKREALGAVLAMSGILEITTLARTVTLEGANPPSPVEPRSARDYELAKNAQPGGNYYRCSGSVPFCLVSVR